jgi:oligopeptide transport system substrate-binding protein
MQMQTFRPLPPVGAAKFGPLRGTTSKRARRSRFTFAWALLGGLLLTGCGRRETEVSIADKKGILLVGNGGEVQTLDPHWAGGMIDHNIQSALSEGLVTMDEITLEVHPGMAESWDVSPDGLHYTFHLRPNLRWSNGDPMLREDWMFSFARALTPKLASEYHDLYYPVVGAFDYAQGKTKDFSTVGIVMPDEHTIVITLRERTPYFLSLLRNNIWYPVQKKAVLSNGEWDERNNRWTIKARVSNGPFRLVDWKIHQWTELEKNPYYWDAAHVRLNGIKFYANESEQSQDLAFRAGQLHVTWSVPLSKLQSYRTTHDPFLHEDPSFETTFVRFLVTKPPFTDPRVRRAFSLAIDREAIVKSILRGKQQPGFSLVPSGFQGYQPPSGHVKFDPAAARALLAAAGYPAGKGFPSVEFLTISAETDLRIGEALCEMWRTNLGVNVGPHQEEFQIYLKSINASSFNYTIARGRWRPEFPDPLAFLEIMGSTNLVNGTAYADPKYDQMLEDANKLGDPAARSAALQAAEAYMLDAAPIAPVYFGTTARLQRPEVRGWKISPVGFHNYKDVWIEP